MFWQRCSSEQRRLILTRYILLTAEVCIVTLALRRRGDSPANRAKPQQHPHLHRKRA